MSSPHLLQFKSFFFQANFYIYFEVLLKAFYIFVEYRIFNHLNNIFCLQLFSYSLPFCRQFYRRKRGLDLYCSPCEISLLASCRNPLLSLNISNNVCWLSSLFQVMLFNSCFHRILMKGISYCLINVLILIPKESFIAFVE